MQPISTLRLLANIITDAVDVMEQVYTTAGIPLPSLDEPYQRHDPGEALRQTPEVTGAVRNIMAAAAQITAAVCDPVTMTINSAFAVSMVRAESILLTKSTVSHFFLPPCRIGDQCR